MSEVNEYVVVIPDEVKNGRLTWKTNDDGNIVILYETGSGEAMTGKELEDQLTCKYFDLEIKFNEIADLFKDIARLRMRLQKSRETEP